MVERTAAEDEALSHSATTDEDRGWPGGLRLICCRDRRISHGGSTAVGTVAIGKGQSAYRSAVHIFDCG